MRTGCQGPFCHGTGGWCGCNCKCCPPPCCNVISVYFECGSTATETNPDGCETVNLWDHLDLPGPPQDMPSFTNERIISKDGKFVFGATAGDCSVPCETVCVPVTVGPTMPACCLELLAGRIYSVGNGYVTAPATIDPNNGIYPYDCQLYNVKLNGQEPPIFVNDCEEIIVTLEPVSECCECTQVDIRCAPCSSVALFTKKMVDGNVKLNPKTGKPYVYLNKKELMRRLKLRREQLRRLRK